MGRLLPAGLALAVGVPCIADAEERILLSVISGAFDVTKDGAEHPEAGFEVRFPPTTLLGVLPQRFPIRPTLGAAGTGLGSLWTYVGFCIDQKIGRLVLTPGFAMSLYEEGSGLDLGGLMEFRSSFEAACRIRGQLHVGVSFYHLSNGSLYQQNPGSESIVVTLTVPLTGP